MNLIPLLISLGASWTAAPPMRDPTLSPCMFDAIVRKAVVISQPALMGVDPRPLASWGKVTADYRADRVRVDEVVIDSFRTILKTVRVPALDRIDILHCSMSLDSDHSSCPRTPRTYLLVGLPRSGATYALEQDRTSEIALEPSQVIVRVLRVEQTREGSAMHVMDFVVGVAPGRCTVDRAIGLVSVN